MSTQGPGQTGLPLREVRQFVDPVGFDDKGFSTKLLEHRSRLSTMEERSTLLRSSGSRRRSSLSSQWVHTMRTQVPQLKFNQSCGNNEAARIKCVVK